MDQEHGSSGPTTDGFSMVSAHFPCLSLAAPSDTKDMDIRCHFRYQGHGLSRVPIPEPCCIFRYQGYGYQVAFKETQVSSFSLKFKKGFINSVYQQSQFKYNAWSIDHLYHHTRFICLPCTATVCPFNTGCAVVHGCGHTVFCGQLMNE
eukprot:848845-Pelagomonas_calceolata.AAC.2